MALVDAECVLGALQRGGMPVPRRGDGRVAGR
ncbi:hypothetical protein SAMN05428965_1942 [Geodermatophilus sp. DSM 45219]|nr:hypothetical protein SAMN05428965_1942 [Geodermatophilus sp. DSM 45219]